MSAAEHLAKGLYGKVITGDKACIGSEGVTQSACKHTDEQDQAETVARACKRIGASLSV